MKAELQEVQRYGRNKRTVINHSYIDSGQYRSKFDKISDDKDLNRKVYQIAKTMLKHRTGTLLEDMYWIDIASLKIVASETDQKIASKIKYSKNTKKEIKKHSNLLTIHTHPNSMPPSINDFNSAFKNGYHLCMVCCHNGKIFLYHAKRHVNEFLYKGHITKYKRRGYNDYDAQMIVLEELQRNNDIFFKEVK